MSDKEMKDIWMGADDGARINLDQSQLMINLNTKIKKIDRVLFFRDAREILAALIVTIFFGYKSYVESIPLQRVIHILIAMWGIYVMYRLLNIRKYKKISDLGSSLKIQLKQQKMYLQKQAQLLDSVLVWYIAPPAILGMVSIIGRSYSPVIDWMGILFSFILIFGISWGIYALNKKASKTTYQPLIENIDNVLVQLDENQI